MRGGMGGCWTGGLALVRASRPVLALREEREREREREGEREREREKDRERKIERERERERDRGGGKATGAQARPGQAAGLLLRFDVLLAQAPALQGAEQHAAVWSNVVVK